MQRKINYLPTFIVLAVVSIGLLFIWKTGILSTPSGIVSKISSKPREVTITAVDKNQVPKTSDSVDILKLQKENQALKDQFAVSNPSSLDLIPAMVIGAPTFIPGVTTPDVFILDKGESDGVRKGQAVVLGGNLVGQIVEVNSSASKVILVNNSSISLTGKLESGTVGVVRGTGDAIEIGNILLSDSLSNGDTVLTKGDQDLNFVGFPPDLVVGKVISVEKNPSDLFQKAEVKSEIDFTKINMVFVVVK